MAGRSELANDTGQATAAPPLERRLKEAEAAIGFLRDTIDRLERELGLVRADHERLRIEAERAAGSKLP